MITRLAITHDDGPARFADMFVGIKRQKKNDFDVDEGLPCWITSAMQDACQFLCQCVSLGGFRIIARRGVGLD